MVKWNAWVRRRKINIDDWVKSNGLKKYSDLVEKLNNLGVEPPSFEEASAFLSQEEVVTPEHQNSSPPVAPEPINKEPLDPPPEPPPEAEGPVEQSARTKKMTMAEIKRAAAAAKESDYGVY